MEIPLGYSLLILSRSGHGVFSDIRLVNSVGLIDPDYRGQIFVGLRQDSSFHKETASIYSDLPVKPRLRIDSIQPGDRIAQGIIVPTPRISFTISQSLTSTLRGEEGLGSTGTSHDLSNQPAQLDPPQSI